MKKKFDFTGVETFQRAPEGVHTAKITKIEETTFQGGNSGFKVTFEITAGVGKGCRVIENYPLVDTAMWKLKAFFEACGLKANGRIQVDMDKLIGKTVEITVNHEEYNGSLRARIQEVNKYNVKAKAKNEDIDDDDEDDEEDNEPADDADDEDDEDEEEEEKPAKKSKGKKAEKKSKKSEEKPAKKSSKKAAKKEEPEDEDDDDDDWDDDDWDEE